MSAPHADHLSDEVDRNVAEYRAVSGWAIAALVVGILSASALIGPLLWIIPLLALLTAAIAIWKIHASDGELTGSKLALMGLLLAILFGVAAPVHTVTRHHWLSTRAELFAHGFLQLLQQNEGYAAHQLTLPVEVRRPRNDKLAEQYAKDPEQQATYDNFAKREPVKTLLELGDQVKADWQRTDYLGGGDGRDMLGVRYQLQYQKPDAARPSGIRIVLQRSVSSQQHEQWQITAADPFSADDAN